MKIKEKNGVVLLVADKNKYLVTDACPGKKMRMAFVKKRADAAQYREEEVK